MFLPVRFPHALFNVQAPPTRVAPIMQAVPGAFVYGAGYDYIKGQSTWKKGTIVPDGATICAPFNSLKYVERWLSKQKIDYSVSVNDFNHPGDLPQTKESKYVFEAKGREAIAVCPTVKDNWAKDFASYQAELAGLVTSGWTRLLLNWIGGSGKTLAAIVAAELVPGPTVYVVPSGVRPGWAKESKVACIVEEATGEPAFMCMPKSKGVGPDHLVNYIRDCKVNKRPIRIVVGHEYLSYWADIIKSVKPTCIIFDEVDVIATEKKVKATIDKKGSYNFKKLRSEKTGRKKRGVSAQELSELESVKLCLGLTATPFAKGVPESFWAVANLVLPASFGLGSYQYKGRYCGGKQGEWGLVFSKATNIPELKWRTLHFMHRVTYEEALADLPPISYGLLVIRKEDQQSGLRYNEKYTYNQAIRHSGKDPSLPPAHELREAYICELSRKVVVQKAVEEAVSGGRCNIMVGRLFQADAWVKAINLALAKKTDKGAPRPGVYCVTGESMTPEEKYAVIEEYSTNPHGGIIVTTWQSSGRGVDGLQQTTLGIITLILKSAVFDQIRFRWDRKGRKVRHRTEVCLVEGTHMESQLRELSKGVEFYRDFVQSDAFQNILNALTEEEATAEDAIDSLLSFCF